MDREVALVWAQDLERIDIADAVEAATMHYRESTAWIMPNHVIANVRRVRETRDRENRIRRQLDPAPPVFSDEGFNAYWAEVQRLKELKKAGGGESK